MKIVAFAASSSRQSINKKLVTYASQFLEGAQVEILDLNDYAMPLFSVDLEAEIGHPEAAHQFLAKINAADALLISFAEHNGAYTAAYKNLFDWCSRVQAKVYEGKPVVLISTSPGARGALSSLELAAGSIHRFGATLKGKMSVPSFYDQFNEAGELFNAELKQQLKDTVSLLLNTEPTA